MRPKGLIDGKHYTEYVPDILQLKREGRYGEAEMLLLTICDTVEREEDRRSLPPAYYEHLAIIYAKQGRIHDEIAILERYENLMRGVSLRRGRLSQRLDKARARLSKSSAGL